MTYYVEFELIHSYNHVIDIGYQKWKLGADDMEVIIRRFRLSSYFKGSVLKLGIL